MHSVRFSTPLSGFGFTDMNLNGDTHTATTGGLEWRSMVPPRCGGLVCQSEIDKVLEFSNLANGFQF